MVLVYLPTWLGDFVRANVGKYASTMEHMGNGKKHPMVASEDFPTWTGAGKCPNWTSPTYWGYNIQKIIESDVQNPQNGTFTLMNYVIVEPWQIHLPHPIILVASFMAQYPTKNGMFNGSVVTVWGHPQINELDLFLLGWQYSVTSLNDLDEGSTELWHIMTLWGSIQEKQGKCPLVIKQGNEKSL